MDLEYDMNFDYDELCTFIRVHHDNKELCLVCMTDETETGQLWTRYELKCSHKFHSRCLRKWCRIKNSINCSCCGKIPEVVENMFCYECQEFGHNCELE
jgi:hypothetical protein